MPQRDQKIGQFFTPQSCEAVEDDTRPQRQKTEKCIWHNMFVFVRLANKAIQIISEKENFRQIRKESWKFFVWSSKGEER